MREIVYERAELTEERRLVAETAERAARRFADIFRRGGSVRFYVPAPIASWRFASTVPAEQMVPTGEVRPAGTISDEHGGGVRLNEFRYKDDVFFVDEYGRCFVRADGAQRPTCAPDTTDNAGGVA